MPREGVVGLERAIQQDWLNWGAHVTRAVDSEAVVEADFHLAEVRGFFEKVPFSLGSGDLRAGASEPGGALALLPMMVGEQDPFDALDANFLEMIQHASVPKVDEKGGVAISNHIDVAGVAPDRDVRGEPGVNWSEVGGGGREQKKRQSHTQARRFVSC